MKNSGRMNVNYPAVFLVALILASSSSAITFDMSGNFVCHPLCIEGNVGSVEERIYNPNESWAYIYYVEMNDSSGFSLCKTTLNVNLSQGESRDFSCSGTLPATPADGIWIGTLWVIYASPSTGNERAMARMVSVDIPIAEQQCTKNADCNDDENCSHHACVALTCYAAEHVENHSCVKTECYLDSDCGRLGACRSNKCIYHECEADRDCNASMKCINQECHQCGQDADCKSDEVCKGNCTPLQCGDTAIPKFHVCFSECNVDANCSDSSICSNHTCVQPQCDNGQVMNHTCVPYQCSSDPACADNEACRSRMCVPVQCQAGYVVLNHACVECRNDSDCGDEAACISQRCQEVLCQSGRIISHACVTNETQPASSHPQESQPAPASTGTSSKGCASAFILAVLSVFGYASVKK